MHNEEACKVVEAGHNHKDSSSSSLNLLLILYINADKEPQIKTQWRDDEWAAIIYPNKLQRSIQHLEELKEFPHGLAINEFHGQNCHLMNGVLSKSLQG
jgi:hypothetical protein